MLLCFLPAWAQNYRLELTDSLPPAAGEMLLQRFTQMLEAGGLSVADEGAPLQISARVKDRMETPGTISQVALQVEIKAVAGEVEEVFPVKGVGENEADAWLRAVKQILPRAKAAQAFVDKLK